MTDLASKQRLRHGAYALCFAASLPHLQAVAAQHGYALAVHGSMSTDLDLIAAPWVEDAAEPAALIEALREVVDGQMFNDIDPNPSVRPHGRLAWSIYTRDDQYRGGPYLDVSVMPPTSRKN